MVKNGGEEEGGEEDGEEGHEEGGEEELEEEVIPIHLVRLSPSVGLPPVEARPVDLPSEHGSASSRGNCADRREDRERSVLTRSQGRPSFFVSGGRVECPHG